MVKIFLFIFPLFLISACQQSPLLYELNRLLSYPDLTEYSASIVSNSGRWTHHHKELQFTVKNREIVFFSAINSVNGMTDEQYSCYQGYGDEIGDTWCSCEFFITARDDTLGFLGQGWSQRACSTENYLDLKEILTAEKLKKHMKNYLFSQKNLTITKTFDKNLLCYAISRDQLNVEELRELYKLCFKDRTLVTYIDYSPVNIYALSATPTSWELISLQRDSRS